MPLLEDLLLRFRRIWAPPGAVTGQAAVPEEAGSRLDDEARELTASLAEIDAEAAEVVNRAQAEAGSIVAAAEADAERTLEAAMSRVPQLRAEHAAARVQKRHVEMGQIVAEADSAAGRIAATAAARTPALVLRIVEEILPALTTGEVEHARIVGRG